MKIKALCAFSRVYLAILLVAGIVPAASGGPINLAIVTENSAIQPAADFLTVELSKQTGLVLLERDKITKVLNEQALGTAAGHERDYLQLGRLLGADGVLILSSVEKEDQQVLSCRFVAVKPGVELGMADYAFPLADPEQWSKLVAGQVNLLLSKLTVAHQDAVPISILNLRSAAASPESEVLERQLTLLLHDRLMTEKNLFVLERRSMETLSNEKEESSISESPFWNGSYLVEGTIDPHGVQTGQVTVDIRITPPDKKNVATAEVAGSLSNLSGVINDLALRVVTSATHGSLNTQWNTEDEANRYFEEGQWMLRWRMAPEAKTASEAAWALGKQTPEAAELRVKAYQACADNVGIPFVLYDHVVFLQPPELGELGLNDYEDFASAPPVAGFSAIIRASELWLNWYNGSTDTAKRPDVSWISLGETNLVRCSDWLRYYYFNVEARAGQEDGIRHARELCRETSGLLSERLDGKDAEALLHVVAKNTAFWSESPEETVQFYQKLVDQGRWQSVRTRFFNSANREGINSIQGHNASESADQALPCVAGWDWQSRSRCPELWNSFIDSLCASSQPSIQMEGLMLKCSYSWSEADFKSNLSRLEDFIRAETNVFSDGGDHQNLVTDLQSLMDIRVEGMSNDPMEKVEDDSWKNFKRELEQLVKNGRKKITAEEQYLQTQTNFDFISFSEILLPRQYSATEAKFLLPVVTGYHERIDSHPGQFQNQADFWIGVLEKKLKVAISPPPPSTNTHRVSPVQFASNPFNRGGLPSAHPPVPEKPLSSIKSARFWEIPQGATNSHGDPASCYITGAHFRDGTLWLQMLYSDVSDLGIAGRAEFYGVNLKTFSARHIAFQGEPSSFFRAMIGYGKNRFDVDGNYLYLWVEDSVRRYSFDKQTWELFPLAGGGQPQRLGSRLFFTSANSIQECLPDGTLRLLASCRRRPAVTPLDDLDDYAPCHLFLDGQGRINVCASNELYVLAGATNWQQRARLATSDFSGAALFENGFIVGGRNDWWGMFGSCPKPELLFQQVPQNRPGYPFQPPNSSAPAASATQWVGQPPAMNACQDGDFLWFLTDPFKPVVLGGWINGRSNNGPSELALVRYKYGEHDSVRIALDPLNQSAHAEIRSSNPRVMNSWLNLWKLTPTPEGLVATKEGASGFWLISRGNLDQAVAEACLRRAAIH